MPPAPPDDSGALTVLILSAGGLLGQNILDALERRRHQLRVVGADAVADNARLFRCDAAYLTPLLDDEAAFSRRFLRILETERPAIVFPGRDHDVLFLSTFRERHRDSGVAIPCGSLRAAEIMQDKMLSFSFAQQNNLPFADSLPLTPEVSGAQVLDWIERHRFPVLAKPRTGYGSVGIKLVFSRDQLARLPRDGSYLLQEFVGQAPELELIQQSWETGVPWFFSIRDEAQYAGQTAISPEGTVLDVFCSLSTMVMGRCEAARPVNDPSMAAVVRSYAAAFAGIGWRGSFNIQLRRGADGTFRCHEFNGRMSGSTSARRFMGYDEIRILVKAFLGRDLGSALDENTWGPGYVVRSLTDYFVPAREVEVLKTTGVWRR